MLEWLTNGWNWLWSNIQSLWSLVEFFAFLGMGFLAWWKFIRKKPTETIGRITVPTRDLKTIYYEGLDSSCELLKLNLIEKKLGQHQAGLSLSEIYQDQHIRVPTFGDHVEGLEQFDCNLTKSTLYYSI
jgi:hypothetical protein